MASPTIISRIELIPQGGAISGGVGGGIGGGDPVLKQTTIRANRAISGSISRSLGTLVTELFGLAIFGSIASIGVSATVAGILTSPAVGLALVGVATLLIGSAAIKGMINENPFGILLRDSVLDMISTVDSAFDRLDNLQFEGNRQSNVISNPVRNLFQQNVAEEKVEATRKEINSQENLVSSTTNTVNALGRAESQLGLVFGEIINLFAVIRSGGRSVPTVGVDSYFSNRGPS